MNLVLLCSLGLAMLVSLPAGAADFSQDDSPSARSSQTEGSGNVLMADSSDTPRPSKVGTGKREVLGSSGGDNEAKRSESELPQQKPGDKVSSDKPNIILILADDLGWTDIQAGLTGPNVLDGRDHGSDFYQTPNLARLASEGLSFTHCYFQPNCAPSRSAMLSGQYAPRSGNGVYNVDDLNRGNGKPELVGPSQNQDIPASHVTYAEALHEAGYITAHFGKYHVGGHEGGEKTLPLNQGFDYNFGGGKFGAPGSYYAKNQKFNHPRVGKELDQWASDYTKEYIEEVLKGPKANPLNRRAEVPNDPELILNDDSNKHGANKQLTDAMGDAALSFLNKHRQGKRSDRPFFMEFNTYAVHARIQPRWDLQQKYVPLPDGTYHSSNQYAGLVEGLDQTVGRILDWLDDPNGDGDTSDSIANNTLVIFVSDNGGHIGDTDNAPLRSRKGSFFEGGLRVPLIVRQPGSIPAGESTDTLVHTVDFYPTLVEYAGTTMPKNITFDGTSFAAHMTDPSHSVRERKPIFYHFPGYLDDRARPCSVIIQRIEDKQYKLIYSYDLNYVGKNSRNEGLKALKDPWELYNITDDISESDNLLTGDHAKQQHYNEVADVMATNLHDWLTQPGSDWDAKQPTERSSGKTVPYAPAQVKRKCRVSG